MAQSPVWQNLSPRSYEEKRNFPRMRLDCALSYAAVGERGTSEGRCKNLSAQGVLFNTLKPMTVGALVDINITPQKAVVAPFNALVEVLRVSSAEGVNNYEIAARIKQIK
jgi:hypothetical protein